MESTGDLHPFVAWGPWTGLVEQHMQDDILSHAGHCDSRSSMCVCVCTIIRLCKKLHVLTCGSSMNLDVEGSQALGDLRPGLQEDDFSKRC